MQIELHCFFIRLSNFGKKLHSIRVGWNKWSTHFEFGIILSPFYKQKSVNIQCATRVRPQIIVRCKTGLSSPFRGARIAYSVNTRKTERSFGTAFNHANTVGSYMTHNQGFFFLNTNENLVIFICLSANKYLAALQ